MNKRNNKKVIIIEPHPDDALGSASGICFSSDVDSIVLTITKTEHEKDDYRDLIELDTVRKRGGSFQKLNIVNHVNAGFVDLHWDKRTEEIMESHEQLLSIYKNDYGIKNYNKLCVWLKAFLNEFILQNKTDDIYVAIPLGVMHPMHVLTTSAFIDVFDSNVINPQHIIFYIEHPYDIYDTYRNQSELAIEYISTKLNVSLSRVDDVSVDMKQTGNIIKDLYTDKHYSEFDGAFHKSMCSYLINSTQEDEIKKFLKIRQNNIAFITTEAIPIYKTGGLGEVVYQLTKVLAKNVNNICIVLPKLSDVVMCSGLSKLNKQSFVYEFADGKKKTMFLEKYKYDRLVYYVVDIGCYKDEGEFFAIFCDVVLQKIVHMLDFVPNVLHCNDWETGLIPLLHKYKYSEVKPYNSMRTVYTVHASCYKGILQKEKITSILKIDKETCKLCSYCTNNCKLKKIDFLTEIQAEKLKVHPTLISVQRIGINFADVVTTVSKGHAEELQEIPEFAQVLIKGIRNGVINQRYKFKAESEFVNINESVMQSEDNSIESIKIDLINEYKSKNKYALQKLCNFTTDDDKLFICMVSRLTDVKGYDYLRQIFDDLIKLPVQILVVGDEDPSNPTYKMFMEDKAKEYPNNFAYREFDKELEFKAYAGADIILMPSIKESCGIAQMTAMNYGTVPVVSNLKCFKDSIVQYGEPLEKNKGIGFYSLHDSWSFFEVISNIIKLYQNDREEWMRIVTSCFQTDFSWINGSLKQYLELYDSIL